MAHKLRNIATDKMRKAGITYQFIDQPDGQPLNIPAKDAVPTLVYRTEAGLIAVQKRADTKVNVGKLKDLVGATKLALASEDDLAQLETEAGVVPLVGLSVPYFVDNKVLERKAIYGGSGEKLYALSLTARDLVKVNNATVGDFSEPDEAAGEKKRVFSGTRPTGRIHLGNYLGMVKGSIELQDRADLDCIYCVVDLHGITTPYDVINYQAGIRNVVLDYLGAGLDPKKCHITIQSHLRAEHLELAYYFGTIYQVARLEDLPTFKEKKEQHPDYVNMGLLYYPVLMAADILLYKAPLVPIGQDQEPHMEVTREIARKFNSMFGETFPEPQSYKTPAQNVPSLIGAGKMSKSKGGTIILTDSLEEIKTTLAKVKTDSGKGDKFPVDGPLANLVSFVELFEGRDRAQQYREQYKTTGIRYGDLKAELAEAIFKELQPIQERRKYYEAHPEEVDQILAEGKEYAQKIARETLDEVREKMGLAI
jgi:tryptophanyl-tRNA synthetase